MVIVCDDDWKRPIGLDHIEGNTAAHDGQRHPCITPQADTKALPVTTTGTITIQSRGVVLGPSPTPCVISQTGDDFTPSFASSVSSQHSSGSIVPATTAGSWALMLFRARSKLREFWHPSPSQRFATAAETLHTLSPEPPNTTRETFPTLSGLESTIRYTREHLRDDGTNTHDPSMTSKVRARALSSPYRLVACNAINRVSVRNQRSTNARERALISYSYPIVEREVHDSEAAIMQSPTRIEAEEEDFPISQIFVGHKDDGRTELLKPELFQGQEYVFTNDVTHITRPIDIPGSGTPSSSSSGQTMISLDPSM